MFNFSLQNVLEVRKRLERIKYKEFSGVLLERQQLSGQIEARKNRLASAAGEIDEFKLRGPSTAPLQIHDRFRERTKNEMVLLSEQLREKEQALEVKRKELVEARRAHRTLEILRDKERDRYEVGLARQERTVMDEIATNYHLFHR